MHAQSRISIIDGLAPKNQESEECINVEVKYLVVDAIEELSSRGSRLELLPYSQVQILFSPKTGFVLGNGEFILENGGKLELDEWIKDKRNIDMGAFQMILINLYHLQS